VSFEDFIQKSMKGLLGLGFKDFWAYYPTTLIFGYRTRMNFETSFTGQDLLRTRLEFGNFGDIENVTGTNMTRLNFDANTDNDVTIPHLLYRFPVSSNLTFTVGPAGVGYTDITDTLTPPSIADDSRGIPSLFGEYSPLYRRGGDGAAVNWEIANNLTLTLGYLAGRANDPSDGAGLFNGTYHALAQLALTGDWGAAGIATRVVTTQRERWISLALRVVCWLTSHLGKTSPHPQTYLLSKDTIDFHPIFNCTAG
jgi:hypothetical protein